MPLDSVFLSGVASELSERITGAKIDKVQQPERDLLLLSLRMPGGNGRLLINARGETAAEKKSFADSMKERRILLPATGFYEFDAKKTRYQFSTDASSVFYLCGLYRIVDGNCRFVILTRAANESMIEIHDRMPVIIEEDQVRPYLTDPDAAAEIIATAAPKLNREKA